MAVLYCLLNSEVQTELKRIILRKLGINYESFQLNANGRNGTVMVVASNERRSTQ